MTARKRRDGAGRETAFAVIMIVVSVLVFLAVHNSETSRQRTA